MRRRLWLASLGVALLLRGLRAVVRWDEVAWQYASYPAATVDALESGQLVEALTRFTGLHPPLWPLLHGLTELLWPAPALWILGSALAGVGAVAVLGWRWPVAGWVLATAPVVVHYSAEVNQYPLLVVVLAGLWTARDAERWGWVLGLGLAAAWTHALGGLSAVLVMLTAPAALRWRLLAGLAVGCLPLVPGVVERLQSEGTFTQPPWKAPLVLRDLFGRFGALGLVLLPWVLRGARRSGAAALGLGGLTVALVGLIALGIAAPHQFSYVAVLLVPWAILVHLGVGRTQGLIVVLGLVQGLWQAAFDLQRVAALAAPGERAIDRALEQAVRPWTCRGEPAPECSGDGVVLLTPPGPNDDDKTASSAVLWRISPLQRLPRVRPYLVDGRPLDHGDHRHGQPRLVDGRVVYVHDWPRPTLERAAAAHERLWVVVYDAGQRADYTSGLAERLGARTERVGADWLLRTGPE